MKMSKTTEYLLRSILAGVIMLAMMLSAVGCAHRDPAQTTEAVAEQTSEPTEAPTPEPTAEPTAGPTPEPTPKPTAEPEPEGPCDALFYGDSITAGGNFAEFFPGLKIVNLGIPGGTLQDMIERIPQVAEREPAKIFLQGGGNNLYSRNLEECVGLFRDLIEALRKACPDAELFIESMLPSDKAVAYWSDCPNRLIQQFNERLKELAGEYGLVYLDTYSAYEVGGELNDEMTQDGIHLKRDAFGPWAEIVRPYLEP